LTVAHDFVSVRHCRECRIRYFRNWRKKNPTKNREYLTKFYGAHPFDRSENTRRIDVLRLSNIHFQIQKNKNGTFTVCRKLVRAGKICEFDDCGVKLTKPEARKSVSFRIVPVPRIVFRFPWFNPSEYTGIIDSQIFEKYEKISCRHDTFDMVEVAEMLAYDFSPPCHCQFATKMRVSFDKFYQQIAYCKPHRSDYDYERLVNVSHRQLEWKRGLELEKSKDRETKENRRSDILKASEETDAFIAQVDALEKETLARLGLDRSFIDAQVEPQIEIDRRQKELEKREREKSKNQYNGGYDIWVCASGKCDLCKHRAQYYKRPIVDHCHCAILGGQCNDCNPLAEISLASDPREPPENMDGTIQTVICDNN